MLQHDLCNVELKTWASYIEHLNKIDCVNDSVLKTFWQLISDIKSTTLVMKWQYM